MSIGLNLVYGVMKIVNWAHGATIMIGAYISYWLFILYGVNPYVGAILAFLVCCAIGFILHDLLLYPISKSPQFGASALLLTYGIGLFIVNVARVLWTDILRRVDLRQPPIKIGVVSISVPYFYGGLIALFGTFILYLFVFKTILGKAIRAVSEDKEVSEVLGINTRTISRLTLSIGMGLAGITGGALSTVFAVTPELGNLLALKATTIVVLGGLGSFLGAFLGSVILAFAEVFGTYFTSPMYQPLFYLVTLFIILLIRPKGLAGE